MGVSVLLAPAKSSAQIHFIRDQLGRGLELEGPFSDKGGAVAEIADRVRTSPLYRGRHVVDATLHAILPQDLLHSGFPPSQLEIPFILPEGVAAHCPESAGEVASSPTVGYRGGKAREADVAALTLLAVSVLRELGVETYFSLYNFGSDDFHETLSALGIGFIPEHIPVIIAPGSPESMIGAVIPDPLNCFLNASPEAFEVLDNDAVLSLIKIRNAFRYTEELMAGIANRMPKSEAERTVRSVQMSMQIGHMLHEGMALWTPEQAVESSTRARGFLGSIGQKSARLGAGENMIHTMICMSCHAVAAASAMLPLESSQEIIRLLGESKHGVDIFKLLDSIPQSPAIEPFREYFAAACLMNEHVHAASECRVDAGKN
jgi:hypothetical protein